QKPGDVEKLAILRIRPARYPVSSRSSRFADSSGSSPGSSLPAGISTWLRSSGLRYCSTTSILPSWRASTATAPGCRTISRPAVPPPGSRTSWVSREMMRPLYSVCLLRVTSSYFLPSDGWIAMASSPRLVSDVLSRILHLPCAMRPRGCAPRNPGEPFARRSVPSRFLGHGPDDFHRQFRRLHEGADRHLFLRRVDVLIADGEVHRRNAEPVENVRVAPPAG